MACEHELVDRVRRHVDRGRRPLDHRVRPARRGRRAARARRRRPRAARDRRAACSTASSPASACACRGGPAPGGCCRSSTSRRAVRARDDVVAPARRRRRRGARRRSRSRPSSPATTCEHGKPHPEPYLLAAAALGVDPDRVRRHRGLPDRRARRRRPPGCVVVAVPNLVRSTPAPGRYRRAQPQGRARRRPRRATSPTTPPPAPPPARAAHRPTPRPGPAAGRCSSAAASSPSSSLAVVAVGVARRRRRRRRRRRATRARSTSTPGRRTGRSTTPCPSSTARADTLHELSPFWFQATGVDTIEVEANTPADAGRGVPRHRPRARRPARGVDPRRHRRRRDGGDPRRPGPARRATSTPSPRSPPTATSTASTSTTSSSPSPTAATRGRRRGRTGWRSSSELAERLHADGRTLTVSIPPVYDAGQTDDSGYWVYDYAAITPLVDSIRVMAYDYSVPSGEPGPIAPLPWVDRVIAGTTRGVRRPVQARARHPAVRLQLGRRHDGHVPGDAPRATSACRRATSSDLAARRGATPVFDAGDGRVVVHVRPRRRATARRRARRRARCTTSTPTAPRSGCSAPSTPASAACRCSRSATRTTRRVDGDRHHRRPARSRRRRRRTAPTTADGRLIEPGWPHEGPPRRRHLRAVPAELRAGRASEPDAGPYAATAGVLDSTLQLLADGATHVARGQRPRHRELPQRPVAGLQDERRHAARAARPDPDGRGGARGDGRHDVGDGRARGRRRARRGRRGRRRRRAGRAGADRHARTRTSASACAARGSCSSTAASGRSSTRPASIAKFGVPPASIPDYLGLVGDSADGFPGIAGWGAKSAVGRARPLRPPRGHPAVGRAVGRPRPARRGQAVGGAAAATSSWPCCSAASPPSSTDVDVGTVDDWAWTGPTADVRRLGRRRRRAPPGRAGRLPRRPPPPSRS